MALAGVAAIALLLPLTLGAGYFLALSPEGVMFNAGDPLAEGRLWMTRERRPTGIALQTSERAASSAPGAACARTILIQLNWERRLSLTRDVGTCQCLPAAAACLIP